MPQTVENIEIVKGTRDFLIVSQWIDDKGRFYVSTGVQYLNQVGERCWTKKGFALKPEEAREYANALLEMADIVEASIEESE